MKFNKILSTIVVAFVGLILCVSVQAQRTATATPTVANGFVIAATVTDGGTGYTTAPIVTISGGGGSGTIAVATVLNGAVDKVIVQNAGYGYSGTPSIIIAAPPSPKPPFSDGLVAYYPFNGNASDESGYGNTGTAYGAMPTVDRFGISGKAFTIVGAQDHIAVPVDFANSQTVTISAWIRFDGTLDGLPPHPIFSRDDNRNGISFAYTSIKTLAFVVGNGGWAGANYPFSPELNKWYFVAGSYDGKISKVYVDGKLVATQLFAGGISYAQNGVNWIGNGNLGGNVPFQGGIDVSVSGSGSMRPGGRYG